MVSLGYCPVLHNLNLSIAEDESTERCQVAVRVIEQKFVVLNAAVTIEPVSTAISPLQHSLVVHHPLTRLAGCHCGGQRLIRGIHTLLVNAFVHSFVWILKAGWDVVEGWSAVERLRAVGGRVRNDIISSVGGHLQPVGVVVLVGGLEVEYAAGFQVPDFEDTLAITLLER